MKSSSEAQILDALKPSDRVLDVGGWACPFNRANWVMDSGPYETRGFYKTIGMPGSQGGEQEFFTADTWVQRDICDKEPWPFEDKFFDFSICSQTLEDLRDPIFVCSELIRVSKAGYIEVPSRLLESTRGWEHPRIAGLAHHRWLVDIETGRIVFTQKFHTIHSRFDLALPRSFLKKIEESQKDSFLFWKGSFEFAENVIHGAENQEQFLKDFVARFYRYPRWRYALERGFGLGLRVWDGLGRRLG